MISSTRVRSRLQLDDPMRGISPVASVTAAAGVWTSPFVRASAQPVARRMAAVLPSSARTRRLPCRYGTLRRNDATRIVSSVGGTKGRR